MKKIMIFLFDGVELLEYSAFTDVFGWNELIGSKDIKIETVSYKSKINCSWGGDINVDRIIKIDENIKEYEAIVIPGGFGSKGYFKEKNNLIFKNIIKKFWNENKYIVAICTGVINTLSTEEIKNRKVTTYLLENKRYFRQLEKYKIFGIEAKEEEICLDKNFFTCSGPGNSLELALILLEKLTNKENVKKIKENMCLKF